MFMGKIKNFVQKFVYHPSISKSETFLMGCIDGMAIGSLTTAYAHLKDTGDPNHFAYAAL